MLLIGLSLLLVGWQSQGGDYRHASTTLETGHPIFPSHLTPQTPASPLQLA